MQFRRAARLSSDSIVYQGASAMSVTANISSLALENSTHFSRDLRSIGLSFQRFERVLGAFLEAALLLGVADREPVLEQHDPGAHEHALELRAGAQALLVLLVGAEAHHPLDAAAVVPGAVEDDDLARRRQVGDVALEVPLGPLALGRGGQGDDGRAARVQRLGDALDRAALARRVAALEDHHDLQALLLDPVLQPDQLELQLGQPRLVDLALDPLRVRRHGLLLSTARKRTPWRPDLALGATWRPAKS